MRTKQIRPLIFIYFLSYRFNILFFVEQGNLLIMQHDSILPVTKRIYVSSLNKNYIQIGNSFFIVKMVP